MITDMADRDTGDINSTCCAILGLEPGASREETEEAFRRLKTGCAATSDWEKLKEITWAYETLSGSFETGVEKKTPQTAAMTADDETTLIELIFPPQVKINPLYFAGRCLVFLLILYVGIWLMVHLPSSEKAGHSFFHNISLPFHEAGHIFFRLLGDFMGVLGGSILQVLIPVVCLVVFIKRGDVFASAFALWWAGQNFVDMAPYINDARAQQLILLGGVTGEDVPGYHDWNNILGRLGLLSWDHALANMSHFFGAFLMVAAFVWAGTILYMQYRNLDR